MLEGVNIEEIKQYNQNLRAHTERASKLRAEIEFNNAELARACAELTAELGIQVTLDNIESIYAERVSSINSTLQSGMEILRRVAEEEKAANDEEALKSIVNNGGIIEEEPIQQVTPQTVLSTPTIQI